MKHFHKTTLGRFGDHLPTDGEGFVHLTDAQESNVVTLRDYYYSYPKAEAHVTAAAKRRGLSDKTIAVSKALAALQHGQEQ